MLHVLRDYLPLIPQLLAIPHIWKGLDIDYEQPRVERLWTQINEDRILLHKIYPCKAPFFHPHPWPSAVKILTGTYTMQVGYSTTLEEPPVAATVLLKQESEYEMIDRNGWHSVNPHQVPSFSIMVTGVPWRRDMPNVPEKPSKPLTAERRAQLRTEFARLFPQSAEND